MSHRTSTRIRIIKTAKNKKVAIDLATWIFLMDTINYLDR